MSNCAICGREEVCVFIESYCPNADNHQTPAALPPVAYVPDVPPLLKPEWFSSSCTMPKPKFKYSWGDMTAFGRLAGDEFDKVIATYAAEIERRVYEEMKKPATFVTGETNAGRVLCS